MNRVRALIPAIAYLFIFSVPVASRAQVWSLATVDTAGTLADSNSLAFNPLTGFPAIGYSDGTSDDVKLASWNGASWDIQVVDPGKNVAGNISLAFDPAGNPALSYGGLLGSLKCARWNGSAWNIGVVDRAAPTGNNATSLAYQNGQPSIAYSVKGALRFARFTGASWVTETVDGKGQDSFSYVSLAYAPDGNPSIAYRYGTGTATLRFAHKLGSAWTIQNVETGYYFGIFASLAYDPLTGYPSIAHGNGNLTNLRFLRWDGSQWVLEIAALGQCSYVSLAYDGAGLPAISYQFAADSSGYKQLHLAHRNGCGGTCWQDELVEDAAPQQLGLNTSLKFAPTGQPSISYSYGYGAWDLRFAQQTP